MTDRIKILPDAVANQIAAGEVVNRPSSVVKELLENSVDAGAGNITVNFRDGGRTLIQVVDDGCGMSPSDARLAFDRHATSKIDKVEDIYRLCTFGFRGEALASIASVAEVELRTRTADSELGTRLEISGGNFVSQEPVSCSAGTQFMIRNIFYNVPARRRFLEKSSTETRHLVAEFQRVALCHPEVAFTLYDNDTIVSRLPAAGLRQRIVNVIGKNIGKNLLELDARTSIVKVEGFTGRPAGARHSNREQYLFVNGRYFKSPYFHKAVLSAYEKLIPHSAQPSYFIFLTVDPERIDVNVHPQKIEVKFEDGQQIWQIINAAVKESLAKSGEVPALDFDLDTETEIPVFRRTAEYRIPQIRSNPDFNPFRYTDNISQLDSAGGITAREYSPEYDPVFSGEDQQPGTEIFNDKDSAGTDIGQLLPGSGNSTGIVFQAGTKYAVIPGENGLKVIDIRRAFEAVYYDRYLMLLGSGSSASQQLLFPERIIMSEDDYQVLSSNIGDLAAFGFDITLPETLTAEIRGVPAEFTSQSCERLIFELLDLLRDGHTGTDDHKRKVIAQSMARLAAAPRNTVMNAEELTALLRQLEESINPSFTPTGLPVSTVITEEEIAGRLKRKY